MRLRMKKIQKIKRHDDKIKLGVNKIKISELWYFSKKKSSVFILVLKIVHDKESRR